MRTARYPYNSTLDAERKCDKRERMKFPEGHPRPYIRDGVPLLPREEQRKILADAGVPLHQLFDDKLSGRAIKRKMPSELVLRADLVRPTSRVYPEVIFVAEFRVLGWTMPDIADTLAKAARRHVIAVVAVKSERILPLSVDDAVLLDALTEIDSERRRIASDLVLASNRASQKRRRDRVWEKLKKEIEPLWFADPDSHDYMTGKDIAFRFSKSLRTLQNRMGKRRRENA